MISLIANYVMCVMFRLKNRMTLLKVCKKMNKICINKAKNKNILPKSLADCL